MKIDDYLYEVKEGVLTKVKIGNEIREYIQKPDRESPLPILRFCDFCGIKENDLIEESGFQICKSCILGC
jgi:hypothetical protein